MPQGLKAGQVLEMAKAVLTQGAGQTFQAWLKESLDEAEDNTDPQTRKQAALDAFTRMLLALLSDPVTSPVGGLVFKLDHADEGIRRFLQVGPDCTEVLHVDLEDLPHQAYKAIETSELFDARYTGVCVVMTVPVMAWESDLKPTDQLVRPSSKLIMPD